MGAVRTRKFHPAPASFGPVLLVGGLVAGDAGSRSGWSVAAVGGVLVATALLMAWRTTAGGVIAAGLWLIVVAAIGWQLPPELGVDRRLLGGFAAAGLVVVWAGVRTGRRPGSRAVVAHWSDRTDRNDGVASRWQLFRHASTWPIRRKAVVLRPSLQTYPWPLRRFVKISELATRVAKVGIFGIWSACEDVTVRFGGPRVGKTGELACRIVDAPGAVIATSTRTDLIDLTSEHRGQTGPAFVFNPSGMGDLESTITFDPLMGCEDPVTATDRAGDLLSAVSAPGAGGDNAFWTDQAQRVLASLMHAAALEPDGGMRDVLVWVADPDGSRDEIQRYLRRSPVTSFVEDALQFLTTNDRTRSSICATIMPALGWLTNPHAEKSATGGGFNVADLLDQRATVYMLGAEEAKTAPLVTALTGHIAREARAIAARMPKGRLDPPLTLALDEAALICPVPLDKWSADMGGRNITIHIAAQSRAQLEAKFGDTAARAILNNTATLLIFGGTKDADDLQAFATLIGERAEQVTTVDDETGHTSTTNRRVAVLTPSQLAQLGPGQVVIIRRSMPVAIGRVQMIWKRRDVRWAARRRHLVATCRNAYVAARPQIEAAYAWTKPRVRAAGVWLRIQALILLARMRQRRLARHGRPIPLPPAPRRELIEAAVSVDTASGDRVASVTSLEDWKEQDQ